VLVCASRGGISIPKLEKMLKQKSFVCVNSKCGKPFIEPILVENLSMKKGKSYYACPHCMTEIDVAEKKEEEKVAEMKQIEPEISPSKLKVQPPTQSSPSKCQHHFGYLENRPKNTPIPEECLTCDKIVRCMFNA